MAALTNSGNQDTVASMDLLQQAVTSVLGDEGFTVPSPRAEAAVLCGNSLLSHWQEMRETISTFSQAMISSLRTCFKPGRSLRVQRENMWKSYYQLRTSASFISMWKEFIRNVASVNAEPVFYQGVTDKLFADLIKCNFPIAAHDQREQSNPITLEEKMALRYVAGYVCRRVKSDIDKSQHARKEDMLFCVFNLTGDAFDDDDATEAWVNSVDRGGLWHITDETYALFECMERNIRQKMTLSAITKMDGGSKKMILDGLMKDEDVLFTWCILTVDSSEEVSSKVLKMLVELYVRVRGFSYASTCLEMYKQSKRKTLQRAKGIRKDLYTSKST